MYVPPGLCSFYSIVLPSGRPSGTFNILWILLPKGRPSGTGFINTVGCGFEYKNHCNELNQGFAAKRCDATAAKSVIYGLGP